MNKSTQHAMQTAILTVALVLLLGTTGRAGIEAAFDVLPFKNNIDKNLEYARNLYEFGNRDQSLELFATTIATFGRANKMQEKAKAHYSLGTLYYRDEKKWKRSERTPETQATWERKCNERAIAELTDYLRCFSGNRSSQKSNVQYDTVFKMIIAIFDENNEYDKAIDWLIQYEEFRNPDFYQDSVDFIKFTLAEMQSKAGRYAEAYDLYKQVVAFRSGTWPLSAKKRPSQNTKETS